MDLVTARLQLRALGANPGHEHRVLRLWSHGLPQDSGKRRPEDFLPRTLRDGLPAWVDRVDALARVQSRHPAADGSERLLIALGDDRTVEAVLLPRGGLCISSQVGCAVGCVFCMTGRDGLVRQLGSAEIVAQVALARRIRPVTKVVFMGMGEPAHNLDSVLDAIEFLGGPGNLGHKNIVFSTVGDRRVFERLPLGRVKPALAVSLHTTRAALRRRLLPRAPAFEPAELVDASEAYAQATGHPVQYQWTLLDGINDGDDEVDGLVRLLAGKRACLNLIPYNRIDGLDFQRPAADRILALARRLQQRGVLTKIRRSAGQDIDAGCGQLRAREAAPVRWSVPAKAPTAHTAHPSWTNPPSASVT